MRPTATLFGWREQPVITSAVRERLEAGFALLHVHLLSAGDSVPEGPRPDFLFSFCPVILRAGALAWPRMAAINFHTAPPAWPGRGGCSWAILRGDTTYGVTAHLMTTAIDAGPILRVNPVPMYPADMAATLHARTLAAIPQLAEDMSRDLEANAWATPRSTYVWAGPAKRQKELLPELAVRPDDTDAMIRRRVRAFSFPGKPGAYIERAGIRFEYRFPE